jgi:hypothetical protein
MRIVALASIGCLNFFVSLSQPAMMPSSTSNIEPASAPRRILRLVSDANLSPITASVNRQKEASLRWHLNFTLIEAMPGKPITAIATPFLVAAPPLLIGLLVLRDGVNIPFLDQWHTPLFESNHVRRLAQDDESNVPAAVGQFRIDRKESKQIELGGSAFLSDKRRLLTPSSLVTTTLKENR